MMKLLLSNKEHNAFLSSCLKHSPKKVFISTFGVYLGITYDGRDTTEWGDKYQMASRDFADKLREVEEVNVLVGYSDYKSCKNKERCIDCEKQYVRGLLRLVNHAELFSDLNWRMTSELHLKSYIFYYEQNKIGLTGGRNFTNSDWVDISIPIGAKEIGQIERLAIPAWSKAIEINNDNISKLLEEQDVSEDGFKSVIKGII